MRGGHSFPHKTKTNTKQQGARQETAGRETEAMKIVATFPCFLLKATLLVGGVRLIDAQSMSRFVVQSDCSHHPDFSIKLHQASRSVATLFDANAARIGAMFFDLENVGAVGVTITGLELNYAYLQCTPSPCTGRVKVLTREGTGSGYETSPTGWTEILSTPVTAEDTDIPTPLPDLPSFSVMPGEVLGVAVEGQLRHALSTVDGTNKVYLSSDGLLQVTAVSYAGDPFTDGSNVDNQGVVNANIYYDEMDPPDEPETCNGFNWILAVIVKVLTLGLVRWCGF